MANGALFTGIDHVNIQVTDLTKAVKFYTDVLGCSMVARLNTGPVELVLLGMGGIVVELRETNRQTSPRDGSFDHLALRVSDIFSAAELLKNHGIEFITPEPVEIGPNHYYFFFRGPSGEKIELIQR